MQTHVTHPGPPWKNLTRVSARQIGINRRDLSSSAPHRPTAYIFPPLHITLWAVQLISSAHCALHCPALGSSCCCMYHLSLFFSVPTHCSQFEIAVVQRGPADLSKCPRPPSDLHFINPHPRFLPFIASPAQLMGRNIARGTTDPGY